MISTVLKKKIELFLSDNFSQFKVLKSVLNISGGCINQSYKIETNFQVLFLKYNSNAAEDFFEKEAMNLSLISQSNTIMTPKVLAYNKEFIILEFIDNNLTFDTFFWDRFAKSLADMHRISNSYFGLDYNNYIGTYNQNNKKHQTWVEFYINERLIPLIRTNDLDLDLLKSFDNLFNIMNDVFIEEPPSLLHGDLWSGNFMISDNQPFIFDPAIYFGSREMDISMSKLFGGFDDRFYDVYNECFPLQYNWKERLDICNLYPLLVHLKLFGRTYYTQIKKILDRYS